jgi:lipase
MTSRGARTPVVFVHGFIGHVKMCIETPKMMVRDAIAPDLLGYGSLADVPEAKISIPSQVDWLRQLLRDTYGSRTVDVVGCSVGGVIAMQLARLYPEGIRRIVNYEGNFTLKDAFWSASVGRMTPSEAEIMLQELRQNPGAWLNRSGVRATKATLSTASEWLRFQPASTLRAMGMSVVSETGSPAYLESIRAVMRDHPVFLIAGERSYFDWDLPDWVARAAAGLVVVPKTGHLMMLEDLGKLMTGVTGFLDRPLDGSKLQGHC